jgi:sugar phosphate isomerase/epimerase
VRYVYFTKLLQGLDMPGIVTFLKEAGLDGADLAVRPGYPVTPDNAVAELPRAAKRFRDEGLAIGLVTAPTNLIDPDGATARNLFEASAKAGVLAVKIGYFPYHGNFDADLADARRRLAGFARLAERTGVRACYHTHSGANLGNNGAGLRLLLQDLDAHHVGAFVDTGHTAINGGPIRMELDLVRPWLSLLAIKDMLWEKGPDGWRSRVVPAGEGIVRWGEVGQAVRACKFNGTVSLHGEYETKDLAERQALAQRELALLKKNLA